jgi:hypothetical protein
MAKIHRHDVGFVVGAMLSLWHLIWGLMVLTGVAQAFMDFIFKIHMITPPYQVGLFSWKLTLALIVITFIFGYIIGWVFALIWNKYHKA